MDEVLFLKWLANSWQKGIKKIRNLNTTSLLRIIKVPSTIRLSNSFYENLSDLQSTKEILINSGVLTKRGNAFIFNSSGDKTNTFQQ